MRTLPFPWIELNSQKQCEDRGIIDSAYVPHNKLRQVDPYKGRPVCLLVLLWEKLTGFIFILPEAFDHTLQDKEEQIQLQCWMSILMHTRGSTPEALFATHP